MISEGGFKGIGQVVYFSMLISVGILITVTITLIVQHSLKRMITVARVASILAELVFVSLTYLSAYTIVSESNPAEFMMWLPTMIMFMIPYALPKAMTVSFSSAKIMESRKSVAR